MGQERWVCTQSCHPQTELHLPQCTVGIGYWKSVSTPENAVGEDGRMWVISLKAQVLVILPHTVTAMQTSESQWRGGGSVSPLWWEFDSLPFFLN